MNVDARALGALLRRNLNAFFEKSFSTLAPGQAFVPAWHLQAIGRQLERVRRGEIRRLIINMPPRSLKSIRTSVAFPAFLLGPIRPRVRFLFRRSGEKARQRFSSARGGALVSGPVSRRPHWKKDSETEIELTARGSRLATSVDGTLTGRGGLLIVVDDPLKPDDALSKAQRSAANQWFAHTLLSRLDGKRTGAIVTVMQRVHMDGLSGFLMSQSDEWELLSLPAIAEFEETIPLGNGRSHRRHVGEVLSPEREPLHMLET
jgi:hypothetical protein